jgi:hypothetical protein
MSILDLLAQERAVLYSVEVLSRSALEMLARSVWLSEPMIDPGVRVCRWQEERLESFRQSRNFDLEHADRSRKMIIDTARSLGIEVRPGSKKRPESLVARPSATAAIRHLFADYGDDTLGRDVYSLHSAVTHGTIYALMGRMGNAEDAVPGSRPGTVFARSRVTGREMRMVLVLCIWAYALACSSIDLLYGWEDPARSKEFANADRLIRQTEFS